MQATLEDVVAGSRRHKEQNQDLARTCNQLESETMGLTDRCERLEDTHGEILDTLEKMEDKYQSIELVIEDQVHDMVYGRIASYQSSSVIRARLVGFLEVTLSSSLIVPVLRLLFAAALARFRLWYSRSLFFFC